jgi:thioesterase domain-containing protein
MAFVFLGFDGQRPIAGPSVAAAQTSGSPQATIDHGYVIILRGLMNIWSRGMDTVAKELQARGVRVHLDNHRYWKQLALEVAKRYEADKTTAPIMIVGHSLGANAAVLMADKLGQYNVPVRLIVAFDGLAHTEATQSRISYNVQEVLNFYNSKILGMEMVPGRGFSGKIDNVDVQRVPGAGHIKLDKNPELQARTISLVMQVLAESSSQSASN